MKFFAISLAALAFVTPAFAQSAAPSASAAAPPAASGAPPPKIPE